MKILNFGSLNVDHVYGVDEFVRPGETISSDSYMRISGGKGLNQSVALARAGCDVFHAGRIGADGQFLKDRLAADGVNVSLILDDPAATGHALIQVDRRGQNAIIIHGGANRSVCAKDAEKACALFEADDILLLQNEISAIPEIIHEAKKRGMRIYFNPAPADGNLNNYPLHQIDCLILNETEGECISGVSDHDGIIAELRKRYPKVELILTLGADGVIYSGKDGDIRIPADKVTPVDTTAAGDTFIGYYIAGVTSGRTTEESLRIANRSAGVCVTRKGSADSIPRIDEIIG